MCSGWISLNERKQQDGDECFLKQLFNVILFNFLVPHSHVTEQSKRRGRFFIQDNVRESTVVDSADYGNHFRVKDGNIYVCMCIIISVIKSIVNS